MNSPSAVVVGVEPLAPILARVGVEAPAQRSASPPFRPVQFLGAKSRALPALLATAADEIPAGGRVADLFSGSSLVAQGFAHQGHPVSAFDALDHCSRFARALLGVGRPDEPFRQVDVDGLIESADRAWTESWSEWLTLERAALASRDSEVLVDLTQRLPQIWRRAGAAPDLLELFDKFAPGDDESHGMVTGHYAGSYFGLQQAIDIDLLRSGIRAARAAGRVGRWEEAALLTALLSAASECAFSAGKHYAQPHRVRPNKDLTFLHGRILTDRAKSVPALFRERLQIITAQRCMPGHTAQHASLEQLVANPSSLPEISAIYADPPYTAQQYSRFYHVPETITTYRVPSLQRVGGEVTRGLYPTGRFKSRFCSRRDAPEAFADLCRLAQEKNATLLLSYSYSRSGETGNPRSIELPSLRAILKRFFQDVVERDVGVTYRQFNAAGAATPARADVELLIVARGRA